MVEKSNYKTLFISHGGGPLPLLGDAGHVEMVENLKKLSVEIYRPSTILVISAHWEEKRPTVTASAFPELIYDYYGFPPQSYTITYPAPGHPVLAQSIFSVLEDSGLQPVMDETRGLDHGVFVPLKIMYPEADIPCVQLSLVKGLDPGLHIEIGKALAALGHEGLLIIGSGFSFHNMQSFFSVESAEERRWNESFEEWLIDTCSSEEYDEPMRTERMLHWQKAPHARFCHPREEHLLPLHVCYGINMSSCNDYHRLNILGKRASVYCW